VDKDAKIYVAGHKGLVGSAVHRALRAQGYTNIVVRTSKELDLRDQRATEGFFQAEEPEYVFLAAAKVGGIVANSTRPAEFLYDNLAIQTNAIHCSWRHGAKKLLFLGSSCVYPRLAPQPIKEEYLLTGPLEPTNQAYAIAKLAGIEMCQDYRRQYGANFIAVMPTNLYGPNDNYELESSHVLAALIRKFHLAKLLSEGQFASIYQDFKAFGNCPKNVEGYRRAPQVHEAIAAHLAQAGLYPDRVMLWGSGEPRREFLHVDDLAVACIQLMNTYDSGEMVNLGWGKDLSIRELAATVKAVVGFEGSVGWDASKPDGMPRKLLDVTRAASLGWKPAIDLSEGVRRVYDDYCQGTAR